MKNTITIAIVTALSLFGVGAAFAAESSPVAKVERSADIKAELKKLQKAAGAGEISMKEYNVRKQALLETEQTQQVGEASK